MVEGNFVKELSVKLSSYQDVQELCGLATQMPYRITVTDGHRTVSAKSFMCVFTLKLTQPLLLRLDCGDEEFDRFCQRAERFEAK